MSARRLNCCVPFCRRSAAQESFPECTEYLCGRHYSLVDKRLRLRRAKVKRLRPRFPNRARDVDWRLWTLAKAQAIERAGGL